MIELTARDDPRFARCSRLGSGRFAMEYAQRLVTGTAASSERR
jgi:hypothetical protein